MAEKALLNVRIKEMHENLSNLAKRRATLVKQLRTIINPELMKTL